MLKWWLAPILGVLLCSAAHAQVVEIPLPLSIPAELDFLFNPGAQVLPQIPLMLDGPKHYVSVISHANKNCPGRFKDVEQVPFVESKFEEAQAIFLRNVQGACRSFDEFDGQLSCSAMKFGFLNGKGEVPQWLWERATGEVTNKRKLVHELSKIQHLQDPISKKKIASLKRQLKSPQVIRVNFETKTFLCFLAKKDEGTLKHLFKQMWHLKLAHPHLDLGLLLTLTYRESGPLAFTTSSERVNTYKNGGLDFFGKYLSEVKAKYLPKKYGAYTFINGQRWREAPKFESHGKLLKFPASLPKNELLTAYGTWLLYTENLIKAKMSKPQYGGHAREAFDRLPPPIKKTWTLLGFAGPGGATYENHLAGMRGFGLLTVLTALQYRKEGLEGVMNQTLFDGMKRMKIARGTAVNSDMVEGALGLGHPF